MDPIESKMNKIKWSYVEHDPHALAALIARVEDAARHEDLINYSDLVRGVWFHLPNVNKGQPFQIDVHDWQDLDRPILGEFLGYISMLSYHKGKFMASALGLTKQSSDPAIIFSIG